MQEYFHWINHFFYKIREIPIGDHWSYAWKTGLEEKPDFYLTAYRISEDEYKIDVKEGSITIIWQRQLKK
jgi:hypothetical protein